MKTDPVTAYYQLRAAQTYFQKSPQSLTDKELAWLYGTVERQQRLEQQVMQSAQAAGVVVPDASVRDAMFEIQAQYEDSDQFHNDLESLGLSVSQLIDLLERQLRVEGVLEQQSAKAAPVSLEQARAYYDAHPEKFLKPERRQSWHLLITINPDFPENSRSSVFARLMAIRAEVLADPQRFQPLAQRYSECPTAINGGEMGWIPPGQLYPELDRALFELADGELSEILETDLGGHLLLCTGIDAQQMLTFESVAQSLSDKLFEAHKKKAQKDWLRELS